MATIGRPSKLDNAMITKFADCIRKGVPFNYDCGYCYITPTIARVWMDQGESDLGNGVETLHSIFFLSIKKAEAEFITNSTECISRGDKGWQGRAWLLERTRQETYQQHQVIEPGKDGKVIVRVGGKFQNKKLLTKDD